MAPVVGYQAQLGIDSANPVTQRFDFQTENLVADEDFVDCNGLRGTRSRDASRVRQGNYRVHGPIHLQPSAAELALLLPWILGTAGAGSPTATFALADALATRYVSIDRGLKVPTYAGVAVDRCTIRGAQNRAIDVMLDCVGQTETLGNSGSFPSLSIETTTAPFMFTDLALSVGGSTYDIKDFELVIDNAIDKERFYNSQTLSAVLALDRHVTLKFDPPYGTASALYGLGTTGTHVVGTFTGPGTQVLVFDLVKVCFPRKSPSFVAGRQEEMLPMIGTAYKSSGTLELVTTLHQ